MYDRISMLKKMSISDKFFNMTFEIQSPTLTTNGLPVSFEDQCGWAFRQLVIHMKDYYGWESGKQRMKEAENG